MAKAVSIKVTGPENDVLNGTLMGRLPMAAPSYDVMVHMAGGSNTHDYATLLVDGQAILNRSAINQIRKSIVTQVENQTTAAPAYNQVGKMSLSGHATRASSAGFAVNDEIVRTSDLGWVYRQEPRADAPDALFRAAPGARLTLNLGGMDSTHVTNVFARAIANPLPYPGGLPVGHTGVLQMSAVSNYLDHLQGTPVGVLPSYGNAWRVVITLGAVKDSSTSYTNQPQSATVSVLADSDTVCENFTVPYGEWTNWPVAQRDELIVFIADPGTHLTFNVFNPVGEAGYDLIYRVYATPIF